MSDRWQKQSLSARFEVKKNELTLKLSLITQGSSGWYPCGTECHLAISSTVRGSLPNKPHETCQSGLEPERIMHLASRSRSNRKPLSANNGTEEDHLLSFFFPFEPSFVDPFLDGWRDRRSIAKHAIFNERTSGVIRQHHLVPQMRTSESWASTSEVLWGCLRFDHTNQIERVPKWLFHQRRGGVGGLT